MATISRTQSPNAGTLVSARFNVPGEAMQEKAGTLPIPTLKRRERRAPFAQNSCYALLWFSIVLFLAHLLTACKTSGPTAAQWKAGVARITITPARPVWMAGFGARTNVSQGTFQEL